MGLRVHQCCCGCSLRTGTISIAVCHIVISSAVLILAPKLLYMIHTHIYRKGSGVEEDEEDEEKKRKMNEALLKFVTGFFIALTMAFTFNLIINILLLIGIYKEKPLLVNIWIIVNCLFFMACIGVTVLGIYISFLDWKLALLSLKGSILSAVVTAYFIVVVNSFRHQVDGRQVAPSGDIIPQMVFVIDPPPPPSPPPPPLPSDSPPPPYQKHL